MYFSSNNDNLCIFQFFVIIEYIFSLEHLIDVNCLQVLMNRVFENTGLTGSRLSITHTYAKKTRLIIRYLNIVFEAFLYNEGALKA